MNFFNCRETETGRLWLIVASGLLMALFLSGCATTLPDNDQQAPVTDSIDSITPASGTSEPLPADENDRPGSDTPDTGADGLNAELLYVLLVANIASQRGQNEVAMESISRAAYLSRDRRIVAQAMRLAMRLEDYQRVIELSRLMASIDPDNYHNQLTLANAQFETGQSDEALNILIDLARKQKPGAETVLQSIASLLAKQTPDRILQKFQTRIEAWPENPELTLTAALLASSLKKNEIFRELLDQALLLRPRWETAAMLKLTYLVDFDPDKMSQFADGFLKEFPDARQFRIQYGRLLIQIQQLEKSLLELETVLKQDPESSDALFTSGLIYLEQENLSKSLERFLKFLQLNPENDQARLYIADIEIKQKNYPAAATILRGVSSSDYFLDAQIILSSVIAKQETVEAGIRHLRQISTRTEDETIRIILEQELLYRDFKLFNRSKEALDEGLKKFPGHPDLLYNRGLLAAQLNLLELHEQDMRDLIGQQPDNAHAYNALGYTLADQTDRLDEALELITKALEMMPNDPFILDSMGWVNFRIGNNDKAIEYLRQALKVKEDAEIAAHLGEALWITGNKQEAREIWEQGKEWSPDNATLLDTIERFSSENSSKIQILKGDSINSDFFVSARPQRAQDRSVYQLHENLSTLLTPQSRKKTINRALKSMLATKCPSISVNA